MFGRRIFLMGEGTVTEGEYSRATIIGEGKIYGGSFRNIRIIGRAECYNHLTCGKMSVIGELHAEGSIQLDTLKLTGQADFEQLKVKHLKVRWGNTSQTTYRLQGNIRAAMVEISVPCQIDLGLEAERYFISGQVECSHEIQCEIFSCPGGIQGTALNADKVFLYPRQSSHLDEICASEVMILKQLRDPFLLSKEYKLKMNGKKYTNENSIMEIGRIEADDIRIENVKATAVHGRNVEIGSGCEIDEVEYQEMLKVHPGAVVRESAKL